jgi:aubergine-like protein
LRLNANPSSLSGEWASMCKNSELISTVALQQWLVVYAARNRSLTEDLVNNLKRVGQSVGLSIATPVFVELQDDKKATFIEGIKSRFTEGIQCVVCVLPNANKERYDAIKKLCSVESSVPSQCVIAK